MEVGMMEVETDAKDFGVAVVGTIPAVKRCTSNEDQSTEATSSSSSFPCSTESISIIAARESQKTAASSALPCNSLSQQEIEALLWKEAKYATAKSVSDVSSDPQTTGTANATSELDFSDETLTTPSDATQSLSTDTVVRKRTDYLSWDDYFLAVSALSARRSKDPRHPMGACIVDDRNRIVGIGYNGFPRGCSDDVLPWTISDESSRGSCSNDSPHLHPSMFVIPAVINAILNKCSADVSNCRLYCQHFPSHDCAKMIIQSRIRQVVYCESVSNGNGQSGSIECGGTNDASLRASRIMLSLAGVETIKIQPSRPVIELDLTGMGRSNLDGECVQDEDEGEHDVVAANALDPTIGTIDETHRQFLLREAKFDPLVQSSTRRTNVLSWDDYFTSMAVLTAQRSKDPNTQVGACLVDDQKRIIGLGYNGFPSGCSDDVLPWSRQASNNLHTKYAFVVHAEVNAILNKGSTDVRGATLYVALFPCNECAKVIVQAGIREVVYVHDYYHDTDACRASRIMFTMAGVKLRRHVPAVATIRLELNDRSSCSDQ